ncbi:MAG TPA: C1 family peptidase [Hyphomonadaceae bacterium]|nr:C1 family peptidase [Hyphomonadaceae bacterium]
MAETYINRVKGDQLSGALRPEGRVKAPTLAFKAGGREESVDLRGKFGPVWDQGELNSCTACATVSAVEYLFAQREGKWLMMSPLFVYFNARKISGREMINSPILAAHSPAAVLAWGVCDDESWPYVPDRFNQPPTDDAFRNASIMQAIQYARLGSADEIKASLSAGIPAMFGSDIPRGYYEEARNTGAMPELGKADGAPSGHAMLIVGYDDRARHWIVRNSHGEGFGEKGYLRLPYSVFDKHVWNEDVWAIGALEKLGQRTLMDGTVREAVEDAQRNGAAQTESALKALAKEIGDDLKKRTDDAKLSIRERLQEQERQLEEKRKKDKAP